MSADLDTHQACALPRALRLQTSSPCLLYKLVGSSVNYTQAVPPPLPPTALKGTKMAVGIYQQYTCKDVDLRLALGSTNHVHDHGIFW